MATMKKNHQYRIRKLIPDQLKWTGTSQGATNCDDCMYDPDIVFRDGLPVEYSCDEQMNEAWNLEETSVQFDYEAAMPIGIPIDGNVRLLKWSLLNAAAKLTGLNPRCDFEKQYVDGDDGDRKHRQLAALSYPTTIYAINSVPSNEASQEGECVSLQYDSQISQCLPISAQMQVRYRGSASEASSIQEYLESWFQELLTETPNKLLVGSVTDLSYVGDRAAVSTPETTTNETATNGVVDLAVKAEVLDSNNNIMFGSLISVSTIFVLGSMLLIFRLRQRRNESTEKDLTSPVDLDQLDLETGSTQTSDGSPKAGSYTTIENNTGYDSKQGVMLLADTGVDDPTLPTQDVTNQVIPGASSHDSTEPVMLTSAGLPPLPTRPPMGPRSKSQKLKKRRRRKKKKKKTTLKRVNSRENMNAMEAIPESEDEGSEFGSECDSEYSWTDDEGSSNHSSSGCLTPARSRSLPDSRASSPKLSPQDELFPSDVFSSDFDFDFIIEAPDFPFGTNGDNSKESKSGEERLKPRATRLKDMVSPIKEEQTRPIPLPWL